MQVNHHFFFVLYSFVAMGIITVFEWDLFFPDLLDIFVLTTLPIRDRNLFFARVAAITIFIVGFLFDANFLAPLVIPSSFDPPSLTPLLAGHLLAVTAAGLFSAAFILALQGVFLSVLGARLFRKLSLFLQGAAIAVLLVMLFLFPVLSGAIPVFLQSGSPYVLCFPPFWFLGIYQRVLEGPSALPIYSALAQTGCIALLATIVIAIIAYPFAYRRRVRQLVEGAGTHDTRNWVARPLDKLLNATLLRPPLRRAVFHFISQTLLRVQRYRIYLVLYGGVGLSVVVATILRFTVVHHQVRMEVSGDGIRAATAIIAFWTIAGLRMAFVSPGNQQGSWIFRIVHGRPPRFGSAIQQLQAAKLWVFLTALSITLAAFFSFRAIAPWELLTWPATVSQLVVSIGMCLLLTDIFFINVKIVAFTGEPSRQQSNLAITLLKYFAFLPVVPWLPIVCESWVEASPIHLVVAAAAIVATHFTLRRAHRAIIREHCEALYLEDDEEEFPLRLGLR